MFRGKQRIQGSADVSLLRWMDGEARATGRCRERLGRDQAGALDRGALYPRPGLFCVEGDELPGGTIAEQTRNQSRVHGVSGALGDNVAKNVVAGESEIADEVEDFVANELVAEP
jgi:hypothetical protein